MVLLSHPETELETQRAALVLPDPRSVRRVSNHTCQRPRPPPALPARSERKISVSCGCTNISLYGVPRRLQKDLAQQNPWQAEAQRGEPANQHPGEELWGWVTQATSPSCPFPVQSSGPLAVLFIWCTSSHWHCELKPWQQSRRFIWSCWFLRFIHARYFSCVSEGCLMIHSC